MKRNTDSLGIVFLHHATDGVTRQNLDSIRSLNPEATIVTISAGDTFSRGYSLGKTKKLRSLHARAPQRSSDVLLCSWFLQRKESADKWWVVEWDTFCTQSVRDYYATVWSYPFVASSVCLRHRQPDWHWFSCLCRIPEEFHPYAVGASPFLYLLDEAALAPTCEMLIEHPIPVANGELRFATAANRSGFPPCGFSPPGDRITWMKTVPVFTSPSIFHPVKELLQKSRPP